MNCHTAYALELHRHRLNRPRAHTAANGSKGPSGVIALAVGLVLLLSGCVGEDGFEPVGVVETDVLFSTPTENGETRWFSSACDIRTDTALIIRDGVLHKRECADTKYTCGWSDERQMFDCVEPNSCPYVTRSGATVFIPGTGWWIDGDHVGCENGRATVHDAGRSPEWIADGGYFCVHETDIEWESYHDRVIFRSPSTEPPVE